jgi:hypothetical protein
MSQTLNYVPTFDGTNYGYWKAWMQFFLKSIDCWNIVETGWTKPEDTTLETVPLKKPSMLYAKHFLLLNLPKFQTANQPKKHGKSWKQHMKARNLLNLPNFKC